MTAYETLMSSLEPVHQLPAATESRTAVVSAGAGSGKTRVLALRYLHLVRERGISPGRILCLTFTKKAAAEMSERIRGMLEACAVDDPVLDQARKDFADARVSTIDSFCSEIARSDSVRFGLAPGFTIDETSAAGSLRTLAMDFLLDRRTEPAVASYLAANTFEQAVDALVGLATGGVFITDRRFDATAQQDALAGELVVLHQSLLESLVPILQLDDGKLASIRAWMAIITGLSTLPPVRTIVEAATCGDRCRYPDAVREAREVYRSIHSQTKPQARWSAEAAPALDAVVPRARIMAEAALHALDALEDRKSVV